jgi:hypothetical protein
VAKARRGRRRRPAGDPPAGSSLREHHGADGRPKTGFTSQGEAERAAFDRRLHDGIDLEVYRCSLCSAWHLARRRS